MLLVRRAWKCRSMEAASLPPSFYFCCKHLSKGRAKISSSSLLSNGRPRSVLNRCTMQAQEEEDDDDDDHEADVTSPAASLKSCKKKPPAKPAISKTKLKKLNREEQERHEKTIVVQAFHAYYKAQYGERWPSLLRALNANPRSSCLANKFADTTFFAENIRGMTDLKRVPFVSIPLYDSTDKFPRPERDDRNVSTSYLLDAASVLATEALELYPEDRVLDLCAAPGFGKCVGQAVVMDYLPEDLRQYVSVTGRDGTQWSQVETFTKVLVDAPCSSERHLLQNHEELCKWSENRTMQCAKRQLALLNAALKNVCVGGLVVYSTCSISNVENDKVIEKVLSRRKVDVEIVCRTWLIGEKTEYGWIVLPDTAAGWGPLYFCVLRRLS